MEKIPFENNELLISAFVDKYETLKESSTDEAESYLADMVNTIDLHLNNEALSDDLGGFSEEELETLREKLMSFVPEDTEEEVL
jgi:hypothetical protein